VLLDVLGGVHDLLAPPIPKERKEIGKKRKKENTYSELFFIWLFGFNGWLFNLQDPSVCYKKKKKKNPYHLMIMIYLNLTLVLFVTDKEQLQMKHI